jgi:hypothetical protein
VFLIPSGIKISLEELAFISKDYREAPQASQGKRNHKMFAAIGQSALTATRTLLSMNDCIGMSLAYRFSINRKMWKRKKVGSGVFICD